MAPSHAARMDEIYHWQRHIYDATRKYFLFGRDALIAGLALEDGGTVLEMGCGTGRNLAQIGRRWPRAQLYGIDISEAMLATARKRLGPDARLGQGDACRLDAVAVLGSAGFDRVILSYTLSMIPDWEAALQQAAGLVALGGSLHIVDFGEGEGLGGPLRHLLRGWLSRFDVTPRHDLPMRARAMAAMQESRIEHSPAPLGYYHLLTLRREAA